MIINNKELLEILVKVSKYSLGPAYISKMDKVLDFVLKIYS